METTIRAARVEDASSIASILRDLGWFPAINAEPLEHAVARVARHLEICLADASHTIYVCEAEDRIVAYVSVHWLPYLMLLGPEGYVSELIVSESCRGQGVGTQLLETVKRDAIARGCARLGLINMRNRESYQRGFYEKRGWTERPAAASFVLPLK